MMTIPQSVTLHDCHNKFTCGYENHGDRYTKQINSGVIHLYRG